MTARTLIVLASLLLALASPAAALGQGAGDEQYQDPFGEEQGQPEPTATPAPAQPAPAQPAPAQPAPAQSSQSQPAPAATPVPAATGPQLPRTGADAGLLALAGGLLLAAGLALRRADRQR